MTFLIDNQQQAIDRLEGRQVAAILQHLHSLFSGRIMHRIRRQRPILNNRLRRDPVAVAHRYLRRFTKFEWHRGGSHVALLNFGPGIGFRNVANDQARKLEPVLIRV